MAQLPEKNVTNNSHIKILSVVWYKVFPPQFGGQKAVAFFNEYLGREAELICLCSKNNEADKPSFEIYPLLPTGKLQFINPLVWRRIYLFAKRQKITHLILEFPYHGIVGFICKKLLKVKLIVNTHNIEFQRFKEQKKWWWGLLYHFEKWTLKNADAVFFKTAQDKELAQKHFGLKENKLFVVSYGVERPGFFSKREARAIIRERHGINQEEKIILFAGTLDYKPNADAVTAIKNQVIPLLNQHSFAYKIVVCGRNKLSQFNYLNKMTDAHLILAGEIKDIELYFKAADVFINPVNSGGGVQTKIIDALAFDLNVVCFQSKRSGINYADNKIFSTEDGNWRAFVSSIMDASKENKDTSPAFFETYNWRTIASTAYQRISTL